MPEHEKAPAPAMGGRGPGDALLGGSHHENKLLGRSEQGHAIAPLIFRNILNDDGHHVGWERVR